MDKRGYLYVDWIRGWIDPQDQESVKRHYPGFKYDNNTAFLSEFLDIVIPLFSNLKEIFYSDLFEEINELVNVLV
ncbi:MAG: hypothetical protein ACREBJ_13615 [Nitrosotalea sp.]